jgi:hypothetical protein
MEGERKNYCSQIIEVILHQPSVHIPTPHSSQCHFVSCLVQTTLQTTPNLCLSVATRVL